jgi:hypothetical protein
MSETRDEKQGAGIAEPRSEIRFAPDARLNIAYNPNYTHESEVREDFVRDVLNRSEKGDRATCPRCDQQAMRFVPVKTAFGLYGIGACERCGYWFLM